VKSFSLVTPRSSPVTVFVKLALPPFGNIRRSRVRRKALKGFEVMAISEDLLEILACPACKAQVQLKSDGSGLKCLSCNRVYPIRDDIPVMLIDEATIEDEESAA
jgi:uncharacterized protein YbaR (Trm112 family)